MNSSNCINHAALIILATLLIPAQLWAETQPVGSPQTESTWIIPLLLLALLAGAAGHLFYQKRSRPPCLPPMEPQDPFCEERITRTFTAALPSLSPELNLEIATSLQTEVLDRSDSKSVLGINLGSNTAQIRAPVTYRYHIRLREPWLLEKKGQSIVVHAPFIRASQPPAIHTDQIQVSCARGWGRMPPPEGLVEELRRDLTATLCRYAEDPRRIEFVRESARQSIAEFVRLWLKRENRWSLQRFTRIEVSFPDERRPKDGSGSEPV